MMTLTEMNRVTHVNTMFDSSRRSAWDGLGEDVKGAVTSAEAMELAGLNWEVSQVPVTYNGEETGFKMNICGANNKVLGVVKDRYRIIQNSDAFDFMDSLLGEGVTYETAGVLNDGKRIWLLAKMPETEILGEAVEPYMVLANNHDGCGSLKVAMTPTRVVCQNTLNLALRNAERVWNGRHSNNLEAKVAEARRTLRLASDYMEQLNLEAEELAKIKIAPADFEIFSERLFPVTEEMGVRKEESQMMLRQGLKQMWLEDDLNNVRDTAWGVLNAVADMVSHRQPARASENWRANNFMSIIDGTTIMNDAQNIIRAW